MEALRSTDSHPLRAPRTAFANQLPWGGMLLSLFLTYLACHRWSATGSSSANESVLFTVLLAACAVLAASTVPGGTLRTFLTLYLALEALGVSGIIGYSTARYLALLIAALLARRLSQVRESAIVLPGIPWLLCLAVVFFLQFFRSWSMRNSLPLLCAGLTFTLVVWSFPWFSKTDVRRAVNAFIMGTVGAGLAFLLLNPLNTYPNRLGFDLGFNPNELGNVVGAALLLLASGFFIRREHFAFWWTVAVLAVLLALTQSRTSMYACFGGIVLFLFLRKKRLIAVSLALATVALLIIGYAREPDDDPFSLTGRLASPVTQSVEDSSTLRRVIIWSYLLTTISSHWKWGVGLGNIPQLTAEADLGEVWEGADRVTQGYQSHNLYLTVLLEFGILGLIFLLAWQLKVISWGIRRSFDLALVVSMMFYLILQGFFQGANLDFLSAFLLVAAYRGQSERGREGHEIRAGLPAVATSNG